MELKKFWWSPEATAAKRVIWFTVNVLWVVLPIYGFYLLLVAPDDELLQTKEAISAASQLGRLDLVSIALAFAGIGMGFFALFSFFQLKQDSADAVAKAVLEIQQNLDSRVVNLCNGEFERMRASTSRPSTKQFSTDDAKELRGD